MNISEIYQLIEKFEASSLSELALEMEGVKLSVKKGTSNPAGIVVSPAVSAFNAAGTTEIGNNAAGQKDITAPLVGTFYRASGPGEKPFVEVGQQVKKGDVVGIIEAMKLMNEITAAEDGVVEAIEAEDGNLVEYGQVLIRLS